MSSPVLHVVAGPNGAGKSTFVAHILQPVTHLPFINADEIAAERWPGAEPAHAYEASAAAAAAREHALASQQSFITETVFSHESKRDLVQQAGSLGYLVELHVVMVPEDLTVSRVGYRVAHGGHSVPETKIRERYGRLWNLIAEARASASTTIFYDNTRARSPFRPVAEYRRGLLVGEAVWPTWTPAVLLGSGT